jgi:hypothetical protein
VIDPITLDITQPLTPIEIENFLDTYGYKQDYSFYLAGQYTQIRVSGSDQYFNFGCYVYPDTTLQSPSWIADEFPFAIVYEAARTLLRQLDLMSNLRAWKNWLQKLTQRLKFKASPPLDTK